MTATPSSNVNAAPPPTLSNETLRNRILTGGGGGGTVRGSLTKVATRYAHFLRTLSQNNQDATATAAAALQTELLLHDLEMRKLILSSKASDENSRRYSTTLVQMQSTLASTQRDIESLTATLGHERRVKKHREEYDALAKVGNASHPPMRETTEELQKVQHEIAKVKREVKEARMEMNVRERQLRMVMTCLRDLKSGLAEEELKKSSKKGSGNDTITGVLSPIQGKKRKHAGDADGVGGGEDRSDNNMSNDDDIGAL
mmetsp:Transcript_5717/g.10322  ORF Transcript_5717/g.10322 Transcript_5717/m.10322 type:complete len:258 (+) Transcript_5717:51-824(+)